MERTASTVRAGQVGAVVGYPPIQSVNNNVPGLYQYYFPPCFFCRSCCLASLQPLAEVQEALRLLADAEEMTAQQGSQPTAASLSDTALRLMDHVNNLLGTWHSRWPVDGGGLGGGGFGASAALLGVLNTRLLLLGLIDRTATTGWGGATASKVSAIGERLLPPTALLVWLC